MSTVDDTSSSVDSRMRRFRRVLRANRRDLPDLLFDTADTLERAIVGSFTLVFVLLVGLISGEPLIEAFGVRNGVLLAALSGLVGGPLVILVGCVSLFLLVSTVEFLVEESEPARRERESLRRDLRQIRTARRSLRQGIAGLNDAIYAVDREDRAARQCGPLVSFLAHRSRRRRARLRRDMSRVYHDSLPEVIRRLQDLVDQPATDETMVVWSPPPRLGSLLSERLLEEYVKFTTGPEVRGRRPNAVIAFTPRWVFDLVLADESRRRGEFRYFTPPRLSAPEITAVPLCGANPEMVEKLFEPGSSGPMGDLAEVVSTALLLQ